MSIFNTLFYNPVLQTLIFIYKNLAFHDLGLAIIILTVFIRVILFPVFHQSVKHQTVMQKLQPKIKKIQDDHKDNKEKQSQALLALYKENQVNPFMGIVLLVVQLPILIALYQVFLNGLNSGVFESYSFLGLINLKNSSILMVGLAAVAQFYQGWLSLPKAAVGSAPNPADKMGRYMIYLMPVVTVFILKSLPAAIAVYWLVTTLFSVGQQIWVNHSLNKEPKINGNPNRENKKPD